MTNRKANSVSYYSGGIFLKKKVIFILLAIVFLLYGYISYNQQFVSRDEIIVGAKKNIPILSEVDIDDISIVASYKKGDHYLFWLDVNDKYHDYEYLVAEFAEVKPDKYKFICKYYAIDRGDDIRALPWEDSYSFLINNEECKTIVINPGYDSEERIEISKHPFHYYCGDPVSDYDFFDANGNSLKH